MCMYNWHTSRHTFCGILPSSFLPLIPTLLCHFRPCYLHLRLLAVVMCWEFLAFNKTLQRQRCPGVIALLFAISRVSRISLLFHFFWLEKTHLAEAGARTRCVADCAFYEWIQLPPGRGFPATTPDWLSDCLPACLADCDERDERRKEAKLCP